MLGRLLSTFSPNAYASRNAGVLESVTEEEHTSGLLFPDPRQLHRSSSSAHAFQTSFNSPNASNTGGYDDRGGLELDVIKDFRIIIAQNAIGDRDEPCILLDSKGTSDSSPSQGLGLDPQVFDPPSGRHSRTSSLSQAPSRRGSLQTGQSSFADGGGLISQAASARKIPPPVSSGAFSRARCRNSISSVTSNSDSTLEPYHNRTAPENGDTGLLNCIFGSSAFSYKGSSTKMHILSTDSDVKGTSPSSREVDALGGRQTPRTSLARTYSSGTQSPGSYFLDRPQQPSSKATILVTRMFSVNLPESRDTSAESPELFGSFAPDSMQDSSFPFPDFAKRRKIKEKKTPMYAVAITIQVPLATRNNARPMSRRSTHGPDGPKQMSFSLDSDPHWSSAFIDENHSQSSGLDDRIDLLVDHWDVITRTLTFLENLARREILILLKKVDAQVSQAPKSNVPKALKMPNMQRTNQTIIQLRPNVLAYNNKLKEELLLNAQRISAALRIPRVVLGQSRWGVWREEARWIARLMADKEHGLFFLVLITAFLGNHTEWLDSLGPDWYRRRHQLQQKLQQDLEPTISSRTVIVSDNKMVARRLIFILSAFLPAKQRFDYVNSPMRPGTSTSNRPLSQSPPTFPLLRQESLRRRINRRARTQRLTTEEPEVPQRSGSVSSSETAHKNIEDAEQTYQPDSPMFSSHRRDSDVRSITAASIPIHAADARTRATTSTTTNNSAMPVPHFTSRRRQIQDESNRAGMDNNDSYASAKLLQNLRRSETNMSSDGNVPAGGTKWVGNILSGFWAGRPDSSQGSDDAASVRRASLAQTSASQSRTEDDNTEGIANSSQLETSPKAARPPSTSDTISIAQSSTTQKNSFEQEELESAPTDNVKDSPLKLSVRGDDGVVDVDLPLRGFLSLSSSNDSTLASPKKARTSVTSMDAGGSMQSSFSNTNCGLKDNESPTLNVGGWLKNFHEDFLVQAVRPYHGIEADIKRAMQAESSPPTSFDPDNASTTDRWVEVASTLVADTRSCTVKRIRLLRKISANTMGSAGVASPSTLRRTSETPSSASHFPGLFGGGARSRKGSIATLAESIDIEEAETKFVEEPVVDVDGTLVDAIERVLIQSGQSSLAHSRTPSPHRTVRVDERERERLAEDTPLPVVEVPRNECRKTVLGALEEVARTVAEDHCRDDNDADFGIDPRDKSGKRRPFRPDNTLREGVRKWLLDIEEAL